MATWTAFDAHLTDVYNTYWNTAQSKPTAFKAILCTGSSAWDETANTATVTGTEISAGNGYSTGGVALATHSSTFDAAQDRAEGRPADISFTASGGAISFDAIAIVATIDSADKVALFLKYGSAQEIADGETRTFTFEGNLGTATADVTAAD